MVRTEYAAFCVFPILRPVSLSPFPRGTLGWGRVWCYLAEALPGVGLGQCSSGVEARAWTADSH